MRVLFSKGLLGSKWGHSIQTHINMCEQLRVVEKGKMKLA